MRQYNPTDAQDIVKQIEQADEIQLNEIIHAVMRRYNALHADREAGFLALSTNPQTRDAELEDILRFIRFHYR